MPCCRMGAFLKMNVHRCDFSVSLFNRIVLLLHIYCIAFPFSNSVPEQVRKHLLKSMHFLSLLSLQSGKNLK